MKLEGKVALITGAGTGIGAAIAERFVADGAKICITGRRQQMLDRLDTGAVALQAGAALTAHRPLQSRRDLQQRPPPGHFKHDAGVGRGRVHHQPAVSAGVQPDTFNRD